MNPLRYSKLSRQTRDTVTSGAFGVTVLLVVLSLLAPHMRQASSAVMQWGSSSSSSSISGGGVAFVEPMRAQAHALFGVWTQKRSVREEDDEATKGDDKKGDDGDDGDDVDSVHGFKMAHLSALEKVNEEKIEEEASSFSFLIVLVVLIMSFVTAFVLRASRFRYLHEAGAAIIFGLVVGACIRFLSNVEQLKKVVVFDRETFFLFLLPPIIFSGGFNTKRRAFFGNIGAILALAFVGTLFSAFVVGGMVYGGVATGLISEGLSFMECMVFGSLISATDPVTVLSLFGMLGVHLNLYSAVFGESVLNDAVAIVLYGAVLKFDGVPFTWTGLGGAVFEFTVIFAGSLLIGVLIGLLASLLFKYADMSKYPVLEASLLVTYAYSSYLLAQGLGLSGIVAILFTGMVMAHYTLLNLSEASQGSVAEVFEIISYLSETFVFVYLGLAIFSFSQDYNAALIVISIIACLVGRLHVFPILMLLNRVRPVRERMTFGDMFVVWFSGLRGAMAFALALGKETEHGEAIFTTTLILVLVTVIIMGGSTVSLLEALQIRLDGSDALALSFDEQLIHDTKIAQSFVARLDRRYLKPFFTRMRATGLSSPGMMRAGSATNFADGHEVRMTRLDSDGDDEHASKPRAKSDGMVPVALETNYASSSSSSTTSSTDSTSSEETARK
jgi:solute carrier family 9 (sodium/hydrogen exchanger), member 8